MRIPTLLLATLLALSAAGSSLTACSKAEAEAAAEVRTEAGTLPEGSLTEAHDNGSVTWHVAPDGQVKAVVKSSDGKLIDKNVIGQLVWKGPGGDKTIPVAQENKGMIVAEGPKLEGDLTEVKYALTVDGKPWVGALHLPAGGTPELAESAKKVAKKAIPKDKKGPNGGVIQVVGDDIVEVVADKGTGQVRVYLLDENFKAIPIGDKKIKLGVVTKDPEIIVLTTDPSGLYVVGKLGTKVDPVKLTVVITTKGHTEVVLVGYNPGVVVVVGSAAPAIQILVVNASWGVVVGKPGVVLVHDDDDDDDDDHHHHGKGKKKGKGHHHH
jgi:hypothetical protein